MDLHCGGSATSVDQAFQILQQAAESWKVPIREYINKYSHPSRIKRLMEDISVNGKPLNKIFDAAILTIIRMECQQAEIEDTKSLLENVVGILCTVAIMNGKRYIQWFPTFDAEKLWEPLLQSTRQRNILFSRNDDGKVYRTMLSMIQGLISPMSEISVRVAAEIFDNVWGDRKFSIAQVARENVSFGLDDDLKSKLALGAIALFGITALFSPVTVAAGMGLTALCLWKDDGKPKRKQ